jgi:hypothetical protein
MRPAVLLLLVLPFTAVAQCGMTTYVGVTQGCHINPQAMVSTNGGTPPYTIVVEKRNAITLAWSTLLNVTNDADGALFAPGNVSDWDNTDRARVTVTDATACIATWTESFGPYVHFLPGTTIAIDCTLGVASLDVTTQLCAGASHQFSIDGNPPQAFASNWVASGPSTYRYSGTLSPGPHFLVMLDTPCLGLPGGPVFCYEPVSIDFTIPAISPGDCGVNFQMRAGLDGALPGGTLMNDGLRTAGVLPSSEPYSALGYAYVGSSPGAPLAPALLSVTGNNAIVDWVVAELRNPASPSTIVYSKAALLQRDGDVIDTDGDPYINFPVAVGNYHVALRHRHHLGVMTSTSRSLSLNSGSAMVDFFNSSWGVYGTNARVQRGSVYCLWAGDVTFDGTVKYVGNGNDRDPILIAIGGSTPTNTVSNVYSPLDVNMDGVIKYIGANNDRDPILTTVGGSTPTNTRTAQLP